MSVVASKVAAYFLECAVHIVRIAAAGVGEDVRGGCFHCFDEQCYQQNSVVSAIAVVSVAVGTCAAVDSDIGMGLVTGNFVALIHSYIGLDCLFGSFDGLLQDASFAATAVEASQVRSLPVTCDNHQWFRWVHHL